MEGGREGGRDGGGEWGRERETESARKTERAFPSICPVAHFKEYCPII